MPGGKFHVPNVVAETRVNKIIIHVPCDQFLSKPEDILEEYYHVLEQWNTGRLTRFRYGLEYLRHGYENNKFELEAKGFADRHKEEFKRCLDCK